MITSISIIELVLIVSNPAGFNMENYVHGQYETVEQCEKEAGILNSQIDDTELSFNVRFVCDVFTYEVIE